MAKEKLSLPYRPNVNKKLFGALQVASNECFYLFKSVGIASR